MLKPKMKEHFEDVLRGGTTLFKVIAKNLLRSGHKSSSNEYDLFVILHNVSKLICLFCLFQ